MVLKAIFSPKTRGNYGILPKNATSGYFLLDLSARYGIVDFGFGGSQSTEKKSRVYDSLFCVSKATVIFCEKWEYEKHHLAQACHYLCDYNSYGRAQAGWILFDLMV